ncbi:unnamed protein product [Rodentolepis nana]|uniref:H15 domain-containing protein n=1 Tax=Rodentolepis nana TaxID=102285 RepID=A0A0R3TKP1_RODNA|nr:unnamed protein product [Rodentolepis nana]
MDESFVSTLLAESRLLGFLRDGAIHMQVKPGSKIKNLVDYVSNRINANFSGQIFCWGLPGAIDKVVPLAEQIKTIWNTKVGSSIIYQCTRLFFHLTQSRVEEYLVKANKPAMAIVLSLHELVEDSNNPPKASVIVTPEQEIPAVETPFPSRRKKRHLEKKRRPDTFQRKSFPSLPKQKSKHGKLSSSGQCNGKSERNISDPCHRLIPAQKLSKMAVAVVVKNVKQHSCT